MNDRLQEIRKRWIRGDNCIVESDIEYLLSLIDTEVVEVRVTSDCPFIFVKDKFLTCKITKKFCAFVYLPLDCPLKQGPITVKMKEE